MAIKRIIGRRDKKFRSCLNCGQHIDKVLRDDEVYTCERCGQQHLIDVYADHITMTVAERPGLRRLGRKIPGLAGRTGRTAGT